MTEPSPVEEPFVVQPRLCFVIMPFSATQACTQEEWTGIFETIIKAAVEGADLGYECRRSDANRGNLIAAILGSLRHAHVVLADLTDLNPNVFYELGVRHALTNRTILLAQDQKFIPFDLRPYAFHVYDWKTKEGREGLTRRLQELLREVDQFPDRPDNPVSDFLRGQAHEQTPVAEVTVSREEAPVAQALAGPESEGVDARRLAERIARGADTLALRTVVRLTRDYYQREWPARIQRMNAKGPPTLSLPEAQVYDYCLPFVEEFARDVLLLEEFGLVLVDAEYEQGMRELLRVIENWLSLDSRTWPGPSSKPISNAPGLLALRLLATWGARASDNLSPQALRILLTSPLNTVEGSGQAASLSVVERRLLFYPEALLGYADRGVRYLMEVAGESPGVQARFASSEEYLGGLSRFLFLAALVYGARHPQEPHPLYPGFKLIPGSRSAISSLTASLKSSPTLLEGVAAMCGEDIATFRANWPVRARTLNEAGLGNRYVQTPWVYVPEEI